MEKSISRMMIETVVKEALKRIKDSPERGIRNLVDMAFQFSEGRFQKYFFSTIQTMLQNENSAYYGLARDTVMYTDEKRLYTFGMNLGYNSCTVGARRIRANEEKMQCRIPWTIFLQIDGKTYEENWERYHALIREGENLGIYTWMIFSADISQSVLSLAEEHPDSAFCIFCEAKHLSAAFLDEVDELYNVMLVVRYEESMADICAVLKKAGLLYSTWYPYEEQDREVIINGDLFSSTQQLSPAFTVLIPRKECSGEVRQQTYQAIKKARQEQAYQTIVWEFYEDHCLIDSIISGDVCFFCFDENGDLYTGEKTIGAERYNLLHHGLAEILTIACPKKGEAK